MRLIFHNSQPLLRLFKLELDRDVFPIWGVQAQISPSHPQDPITNGVWPINILDKSEAGSGVHLNNNGIPFAEVQYDSSNWDNTTVTISHELLEMLVDPYGNRFIQSPDIRSELGQTYGKLLGRSWGSL